MLCFRCFMSHQDALRTKLSLSAGCLWLATPRLNLL